jgi:hypothetical protein
MVRDAQGPDSGITSQHTYPTAAREPFNAMDAAGTDTPSTWIRADAHHAEAGFQDSSLGWVSVRAQASAGVIHAALIPSSEVAGQVLGSHLAGLNAHLIGHHEHLHPITLSTPDAGGNSRDMGREMAQGNGADTSHSRQQHMREDREPVRAGSMARSVHTIAEEPQAILPIQTLTAGPYPMEGHVSFVV